MLIHSPWSWNGAGVTPLPGGGGGGCVGGGGITSDGTCDLQQGAPASQK